MYNWLGAHPGEVDGVQGTRFAVWAPNAREVSVLCDANHWSHGAFYLNGSNTGVWSGFMPGIGHGDNYKYGIRTAGGEVLQKADPVAFYAELRPRTASIVYELGGFDWHDAEWMQHRQAANWFSEPVSIYEVHPSSWMRPGDGSEYLTYRELAHTLVDYVREIGYSHVQLMPPTEHPFDGSWGYQTTGYFAPTSRFGEPHDFMYFVDHCHRNGIGVLLDWVPAHFPSDAHGLARFDGTCLYEHADPRQGYHPDWGSYIFNYGRNEVRDFLINSARFWLDRYHIDGLRVDAVASMLYLDYSRNEGEWIPNQYGGNENLEAIRFLKDFNTAVHGEFPGVLTIAEESTSWPGVSRPVYNGGLGFSMKWDMGWMNDTLRYLNRDPIHRQHHQNDISFRMLYAFDENFVLPLSHDEVVHGKQSLLSQMPGDWWQKFANLRLLYGYQYTTPGKKLLFMGGELAQWDEWNYNSELDWKLTGHRYHDGMRRFVGDLNRIYRDHPPLHETDCLPSGFAWIQADDALNSVFAFSRHASRHQDHVIVVMNCTPVVRKQYRVGAPQAGHYAEILNSDAAIYGGEDVGNLGVVKTEEVPFHGHPQSLSLVLPPLGILVLKSVFVPESPDESESPN
jgi:1,4-alpha-glucan branching enzyme